MTPRAARPRVPARSGEPKPLAKPEAATQPEPSAEPPAAAPEPSPEASEPEPAVTPEPSRPAAAPEPDALAAEVRWLEQARALLTNDPGSALRRASEHKARFPDGSLVAERELIAVEALLRLGRRTEAERRGEALQERFPGTLYRERLKSLFE
jgi:hypothetical protein